MTVDSIFRVASMTKAITSVSVMQLVENERAKLDDPITTYLPELTKIQVLDDFDASTGTAKLRPPKSFPTSANCLRTPPGTATIFSIRS
jgi:methyl acetate hydrolase